MFSILFSPLFLGRFFINKIRLILFLFIRLNSGLIYFTLFLLNKANIVIHTRLQRLASQAQQCQQGFFYSK